MAPSIIFNDAVQGEVFLPGQIFIFGGLALRANSLGHLEQIESYAPGHQVRFGSLNYMADIRGDLIFDGFKPMLGAPHSHDEHDVTLSSDNVREIASTTTPAIKPEQVAPSESGGIDPAMEAALSVAIEPDTDFTPFESCVAEPLDLPPATDSEPPTSVPVESDWAPIMEFTSEDIFQHSPFGDVLNSLRSLSLSGEPWPICVRLEWDADDEEIRSPPTTHFVATVDDLTDMLDFDSEDIDGMDDDAGHEQEPAPTGHWKATSSYDIYMVDIPKDGNGEGTAEDDPSKKQPKRRHQRPRSKSRHSKNGDSGTGDNNTPDSAEDNPLQQDAAQEDGGASPHERRQTKR